MKDDLFGTQHSLIVRDPAAIAAAEGAKARIQAAYIMALQKPRNEDQARSKILAACRRPEFARRVEYAKPIGNKKIKGPSVRFAELALREWGNVDSDIFVMYEDAETRRIKVRLLDCETNAAFSKEITIKKTVERRSKEDREVIGQRTNTNGETVYIVLATDDEFQNKENALISKALRNEGLRLIPSDIIDEAISVARQVQYDEDAKDPAAAKKAVLDGFARINIFPNEIEKYLGHKLDIISPAELQDLRGVFQAIRDGEASWSDYIDVAAAKAEAKLEALKKKVKGESEPKPPHEKGSEAQDGAEEEPASKDTSEKKDPPRKPSKGEQRKLPDSKKQGGDKEPSDNVEEMTLEMLNADFKKILSENLLMAKTALLNCKMKPNSTQFGSIESAKQFFAAYGELLKRDKK